MTIGGLTRAKLVDYYVSACKPREQWLVGMEIEKLGRDLATLRPIRYEGTNASVRSILETYHQIRGGDPVYEGEHLVGIAGPWGTLSLEPGGQVEWSSAPCADLDLLGIEADAHLVALSQAGRSRGVGWLEVAVEPDYRVQQMPWMPKARYKIMADYLGARGRLAHRMMTQTASIQCAFDFESPDDWKRKFRAAALLAPVAVALFANSTRADGSETGYRSYRQRIWRETDDDRCGLPAIVFDPGFGMEAWVDWLLEVPTILQQRARGLVPCGGIPFRRLVERKGCTAVGMDDWELHLSTIFTEVRSYAYLEVRSADLQPDGRAFAVAAFWTGILYHPDALAFALDDLTGHDSHSAWRDSMDSAARSGLDGAAGGRPLRVLASRALAASIRGLRGGAACAGSASDPAAPVVRLAGELRLDLAGAIPP